MNRLKRKASLNTDQKFSGLESSLNELAIQITVQNIDGFAEEYKGDVTITMTNGDTINWNYDINKDDNSGTNVLTINNNSSNAIVSLDNPFDSINQAYKEFLKVQ